ncbi:MAG: M23 family metallopeptidase [Oscillospiraceae bacterium]|nr:M23 family metallopeptidase [Oscillospiraceae bacterium]
MDIFRQKPRHHKKKKISGDRAVFFGLFGRGKTGVGGDRAGISRDRAGSGRNKTASGDRAGFRFPIPSLATVALTALTVAIALLALNWENLEITTPQLYDFRLSEDSNSDEHITKYAMTGISNFLPTLSQPEDNRENTASQDTAAETAVEDNPHGILIEFEWRQYRVKKGDVVSTIAEKFDVSIGAIIASNDITNVRRLPEGKVLKIPNIDGIPYQIKNGDSLSRIAASFNVDLDIILDVNDIKSDVIKPGETIFIPGGRMNDIDLRKSLGDLFIYPLQNRFITSNYGMRRDPITGTLQIHRGIDLRGNIGTPVMASLDGTISHIGENWLYGKYIIMTHPNGYKTLYGHLNAYSVKQGDRVSRGRKIGEVGNTGRSTGPHLHFEIFDRNNRNVNPLELLN